MEKYVLCFKGKSKEGKNEIYPIFEATLKEIDMYTTYRLCYKPYDLYRCLPDSVKSFLDNNLIKDRFNNDSYNFFVRKKCKDIRRGRTDLKVLYTQDSDVVYSNWDDLHRAFLSMKVDFDSYGKDDEEIKIKKDFFADLNRVLIINQPKLAWLIDRNNEESKIDYPNRTRSVTTNTSNIEIVARYVYKDYALRREILKLLKFYKKKIDNLEGKKTRLVDKKTLEQRIANRKFHFPTAMLIINKMLEEEKKYYYNKYPNEYKKEDDKSKKENKKNKEKKNPLEDNPDYLKYLEEHNKSNDSDEIHDSYKDDDFDDFLGPEKPNDPRYWSIN